MTAAAVPFVDLAPQHQSLKEAILADVGELLDSGAFVNGEPVDAFERSFAAFCGRMFCVGVSSGLDALRIALLAAGIEPGDGVIVPANTFIATFEAVTQAGGVPVVVDSTELDYNIDPASVEAAVTDRTRFILPVHLYGHLADVNALETVADAHTLRMVEDACQAHGASRDGRVAGSVGVAGAFSFYPAKNLGAVGDAGALVTDDEALARAALSLRQHGEVEKYRSVRPGYTARLDTLQALVLLRKLRHLPEWNRQRRDAAAFYAAELDGIGDLRLPPSVPGSDPVWHLYVIRTRDPAALASSLRARGIATARHYPELPHLSGAYAELGLRRGSFPVAERISAEALSLPLFPGISDEQLARVIAGVREFFGA